MRPRQGFLVLALLVHGIAWAGGGGTDSLYQEAFRLHGEGKYREAIRALSTVPDDSLTPSGAYQLGMSHAAVNELQLARRFLEHAVRRDSAKTGYRFQLARLLWQIGLPREAEAQYESILALDSTFVPALFQLGLLAFERREFVRASGFFRVTSNLSPRDFLSQYYLGASLASLEKSDSARALLASSLSLNSAYVPAIALLGSLYYAKPDYAEALRLYVRATALRPENADLLYRRGLCEERLDRHRAALASFGAAVSLDSTHVHAYAHIGQVWFQLGKYDSAIIAFEKAVALEEDNPSLHVNIALAWERQDSLERAAGAFKRAIGAHQPDQIAKVYSQLAALYFNAKQMRKAQDTYRRSLQVDPKYSLSQFYLAVTHDELGEYRTAINEYRKFIRLAAGDSTMADKVKAARTRAASLERRR